MENAPSKPVLSVEPWPRFGIKENTTLEDYEWGYLTIYEDASQSFSMKVRPSNEEIEKRWSAYLTGEPTNNLDCDSPTNTDSSNS